MSDVLKIEMAIGAILLFIIILIGLKKNSLSVKYSIPWILLPVVFLLLIIFSEPLNNFAHFLGFETLSNLLFVAIIGLLLILIFSLTVIVSKQQKQIKTLIQEVSLLKHKKK